MIAPGCHPGYGRRHRVACHGTASGRGTVLPVGPSPGADRSPTFPAGDSVVNRLLAELEAGTNRPYVALLSPDSRRTYDEGFADFKMFAEMAGMPYLPESDGDTAHLATIGWYAVWCVEHRPVLGRRAPEVQELPVKRIGLAWSTVTIRLAGVVNHFVELGLPNPRRNPTLHAVLDRLERIHAAGPHHAAALTAPLLRSVIDATYSGVAREKTLVVIFHNGVPLRVLERLSWDDLVVAQEVYTFVTGRGSVRLAGRPEDPELCPIAALAALQSIGCGDASTGPVFPALDGSGHPKRYPADTARPASHQALVKVLRRLADRAGLPLPPGVGAPDLTDPERARAVLRRLET